MTMAIMKYSTALESLRELIAKRGEDYVYGLEERIERMLARRAYLASFGASPRGEAEAMDVAFSNIECHYLDYDDTDHPYDPYTGSAAVRGPSCAVGYVYYTRVPKSLDALMAYEGSGALTLIENLENDNIVGTTIKAGALLAAFQTHQDRGLPYGKCLLLAIQHAANSPSDPSVGE